ncbi:MAG TPA: lytic murein transglycosylase, partial [Solirubrobacteraceae bacterium]
MASGSSEHGPDQAPATGDRAPAGRLRLAAGLAGAGVLAIGFGAGIVQSAAQDADPAAPGQDAVGAGQPEVTPAAQATAESPAVTRTDTSTAPAGVSSTGAPAQEQAAPPQQPPAAPAERATPEQPAAAAAASDAAPSPDAAASNAGEGSDPAAPAAAATDTTDAAAPPADDAAEECPADPAAHAATADAASADPAPSAYAAAPTAAAAKKGAATDCTPAPKPRRDRHSAYAGADEPAAPQKPKHERVDRTPTRAPQHNAGGVPTVANPTTSIAIPGPANVGVPNFFIDKFRIPPFLLSIYQAAGVEYGVRWEVLAAINEIETDYGRNLNVSSAGALGWMQFMPATWKQYGVDANGDGRNDPYNPVDAIFAAARYLQAAGAEQDLRRAIFAYNHADWYVESVLMRARIVGGLPPDMVGSLTGLTQGRFPLDGKARYADDTKDPATLIFANEGTNAVATHDGTVVALGKDKRLGRYVKVRDAFGNTYTYGRLAGLEASYPVAKHGAKPRRHEVRSERSAATPAVEPAAGSASTAGGKERLFANPTRPQAFTAGGEQQLGGEPVPQGRTAYAEELLNLDAPQIRWKRLKPGASVIAGTVLGRVGHTSSTRSPHILFEVRPAGRGAPRIDPKPILDGWKLLETTAIYRAAGKNPFFGPDAKTPSIGQILLMSKDALVRRVLANPRIDVYGCGRRDVRLGAIDRRVLATLEFLAASGFKPTVTSLKCGHSLLTKSGNVSHHSS